MKGILDRPADLSGRGGVDTGEAVAAGSRAKALHELVALGGGDRAARERVGEAL